MKGKKGRYVKVCFVPLPQRIQGYASTKFSTEL
ncbi:hypothetical protein C5S36_12305 [Candidatus Methanophagaceae archaeon]|nr:hypothetical protein C5S36_12305 [Methanophagales archaeon]